MFLAAWAAMTVWYDRSLGRFTARELFRWQNVYISRLMLLSKVIFYHIHRQQTIIC